MEDQAKGFFGKLFDFSFNTFITPTIIAIIYGILMVFAGFGAIAAIVQGFRIGWFAGIVAIILSPIFFILFLIAYRIWLEVVVVLFKIADDLDAIRKRGGQM
jgi:hypothetical protein